MKGLLLKDVINLKKQGKILLVMVLAYAAIGVISKNSAMFGEIVLIICSMMPITAMSFDERSKWDKYALAATITRKQLVISKYLLGFLMNIGAFVVLLFFSIAIDMQKLPENIWIFLAFFAIGVIFQSLTFPLMFRLGVEKARLLMIIVILLPTLGIMLLPPAAQEWLDNHANGVFLGTAGMAILLIYLISMVISIGIYEKKEF